MPINLLLSPRLWAAVTVAVALAASHWKAYHSGGDAVRAEWAVQALDQTEQTNQIQAEVARTNAALQVDADKLRKAKNAQIAKLNTDLAAALDGLRERPARPGEGDLPVNTGTGAGCTGASLYRSDAEFLVRESGRADKLRVDLAECQAAYANARRAVN